MASQSKTLSPVERLGIVRKQYRRFNYLKYLLITAFGAGIVILVYNLWLEDLLAPPQKDTRTVSLPSVKEVKEKRMIKPMFYGYDKKQTPFSVEAEAAHELDENHIHLKKPISALYEVNDMPVKINAKEGVMEKNTQELDLQGDIVLEKGDLTFETNSLHYNSKVQEGFGNEAVKGTSPDKQITAGAFKILDRGNTIQFYKNRPKLLLYPQKAKSAHDNK